MTLEVKAVDSNAKPTGAKVDNVTWTISGKNESWVHPGGPWTVAVSGYFGGSTELSATPVSYSVVLPKVHFKATPGKVAVWEEENKGKIYDVLGAGGSAGPGMKWSYIAQAPSGDHGEIAALQLISTTATQTDTTGTPPQPKSTPLYTPAQMQLDNCALLPLVVDGKIVDPADDVPAGGSATYVNQDSPDVGTAIPPAGTTRAVRRRDDFQTHFLYKSAQPSSVWIPTARMMWSWAGTTTYNPSSKRWGSPTSVTGPTTEPTPERRTPKSGSSTGSYRCGTPTRPRSHAASVGRHSNCTL